MDDEQREPTRREWTGYWSLIVQQTLSAFNDKGAQFLLIVLGGKLMGEASSMETLAAVILALPFFLFAPLAGWLSDRFSKRNVLVVCAITQLILLVGLAGAISMRNFSLAMAGFFALATLTAVFNPAKTGIVKELVGSRHLGFASGIQQMTGMLAFLSGQIIAGLAFDLRLKQSGDGWQAALGPILLITVLAVPPLLASLVIPRTPKGEAAPLRPMLALQHFQQLKDLWRVPALRHSSIGIAFFVGFATFMHVWSLGVAKELTGGATGFGTIASKYMMANSLGMAGGFGVASLLMRRRIELGWVPLAGIVMTAGTLLLAAPDPQSTMFLGLLVMTAFSAALFLAPLNAFFQDRCPAEHRGELLAAAYLLECIGAMLAAGGLMAISSMRLHLHHPWWLGMHAPLILMALICAAVTVHSARLVPAELVRVVGLAILRFFYKIRSTGELNIPAKGGVLLLPNHVTWADAFFLTAACPRPVRFVMEQGFMGQTAIRVFCQLFDTVPISSSKPREALKASAEALKRGDVVCLFPEGQLTRTGSLRELKRGFELIARQAGCPSIPVWSDGAWGSIFSFEGNRFFTKVPQRLRYGISVGFGPPIPPEAADTEVIRHGMLNASALALTARVAAVPEAQRTERANALQIAHVNALQRRGDFGVLEGDPLPDSLPGLIEYEELFGAMRRQSFEADPSRDVLWLGGESLRRHIEQAKTSKGGVFFDFSERAHVPLERGDWLHCPCLAIGGVVVAMSMPDPEPPTPGGKPQAGHKPGALGIVLPGFTVEERDGRWRVSGPAAPEGIELPAGYRVDEESFVVPIA
ncbi:MFS transporter [Haloferula sp. BvORR071]|uniref:MFS transporter n=1 Tax=Haloferula sp. BvORR071 TaxID=1396141 RepID=UPI0005573835|nr:MFS transporter [Haloferula sp. BvORR071]